MSGRYLLDTNIIIGLFSNDPSIISKIKSSEIILIPVVAIGELYYGAYNSKDIENNLSNILEFISSVSIVNSDSITADYYGQIKTKLKKAGNPIPENDIWIAALSRQYNATLITGDKHFDNIDSIFVEYW
jgi:tRNA(fMet)-specific endonuclease VapC